jgi:hypothetical protein
VPSLPPPKFGIGFLTTLFREDDNDDDDDVSFSEEDDVGLRDACASASFDLSFCLDSSLS